MKENLNALMVILCLSVIPTLIILIAGAIMNWKENQTIGDFLCPLGRSAGTDNFWLVYCPVINILFIIVGIGMTIISGTEYILKCVLTKPMTKLFNIKIKNRQ